MKTERKKLVKKPAPNPLSAYALAAGLIPQRGAKSLQSDKVKHLARKPLK
ncbi:MAG: hypothetical protein K8S22_14930 [Betaproteobacteria bacterium]|nr:hypothetical protein [Betaproteobacteria bacterium]